MDSLETRRIDLETRFHELSSGQNKITVELDYYWIWDNGITGNLWLDMIGNAKRESYQKLEKIQDSLTKELNDKIKIFIDDVDKFVADGGEWDLW